MAEETIKLSPIQKVALAVIVASDSDGKMVRKSYVLKGIHNATSPLMNYKNVDIDTAMNTMPEEYVFCCLHAGTSYVSITKAGRKEFFRILYGSST